ncbi:MAG: hypothetical protein PWQ22_656 [Archaeoglobaceae archaeon]|nr:hypothetical protein [Archaeoglobaceae archaeon]MDK2876246.1 hypothetical protein [Archaeoglobaceae archaeon]
METNVLNGVFKAVSDGIMRLRDAERILKNFEIKRNAPFLGESF